MAISNRRSRRSSPGQYHGVVARQTTHSPEHALRRARQAEVPLRHLRGLPRRSGAQDRGAGRIDLEARGTALPTGRRSAGGGSVVSDKRTLPAWLNIDAVIPPELRERIPLCAEAAHKLLDAVLDFSTDWGEYIIE